MKIPTGMPQTRRALDSARADCRGVINKFAAFTAGGALIPLPALGAGVDVSVITNLFAAINERFGLAFEQIKHYNADEQATIRSLIIENGSGIVGQEITKEVIFQILKQAGIQVTAKEILKLIPIFGQAVAAGISYKVLKDIGVSHLGDCYSIGLTALEIRSEENTPRGGSDGECLPPKDEHYYAKILGLTGKLTRTEIKKRYRDIVAKYHPDKVQHLGKEFQEMAEEKAKAINEAYDFFRERYGI